MRRVLLLLRDKAGEKSDEFSAGSRILDCTEKLKKLKFKK
jgi:hypothetical protein